MIISFRIESAIEDTEHRFQNNEHPWVIVVSKLCIGCTLRLKDADAYRLRALMDVYMHCLLRM